MTTTSGADTYTFMINTEDAATGRWTQSPVTGTVIHESHCQQCGSADREDIETLDDEDLQGYTVCCNERVVDGGSCPKFDDCSHR